MGEDRLEGAAAAAGGGGELQLVRIVPAPLARRPGPVPACQQGARIPCNKDLQLIIKGFKLRLSK